MNFQTAQALLEKSNFDYKTFIELLSKHGLKLSDLTEEGDNFLHVLFQCKLIDNENNNRDITDLVSHLVKMKLDVNELNKKGQTPFDLMINHDLIDFENITKIFIQAGLNILCLDKQKNTYLHKMAKKLTYFTQPAAILIANQMSDPFLPNGEGDTFLHVIFREKTTENIKELFSALAKRKIEINHINTNGESCFDILLKDIPYDGDKITKNLLALGLDVTCKNAEGNTYLHRLCQKLDYHPTSIAILLIHAMPDPLVTNNEGNSILHLIFKHSSQYAIKIVEALENKKVDVNHANKNDETCCDFLLNNTNHNSIDTIQKLVKMGLDINRVDALRNSYLHKIPKKMDYNYMLVAIFLANTMNNLSSKDLAQKTILDIWLERTLDPTETSHAYLDFVNNLLIAQSKKLGSQVIWDFIKNPLFDPKIKLKLLTVDTLDFSAKDRDNHSILHMGIDFFILNPHYDYFERAPDFFRLCLSKNLDPYAPGKNREIPLFKISNSKLGSYEKNMLLSYFCEVFKPDLKRCIDNRAIFEMIDISNTLPNALIKIILKDPKLLSEKVFASKFQAYCEEQKHYAALYQMMKSQFSDQKVMNVKLKTIDLKFFGSMEPREYFDTRMLGHRFSLKGRVDYTTSSKKEATEVILTGMSSHESAPVLYTSLITYTAQIDAQSNLELKTLFAAVTDIAGKSLRYYTLTREVEDETFKNEIFEQWLTECKQGISIIYTGYPRHAISLVIAAGKTLYRCNRGGCSLKNDIIEQYTITNPQALTVDVIKKIVSEDDIESNKVFIQKDLHELLGLKLEKIIKGKSQSVGNCSWASKKAGVRASIDALLSRNSNIKSKVELETRVKNTYKAWSKFDKNNFLNFYLQHYANHSVLPCILRRILCTHYDPTSAKDIALGNQIMKTLKTLPRFEESYVEFLIYYWALGFNNKKTQQGQFIAFLKLLNIDLLNLDFSTSTMPNRVKLFHAAINSNTKSVNELLKICHENEITYLGWNPLHIASGNNNIPLITTLCQNYPKWIGMLNAFEETPIMFAANEVVAEKLILAGAVLNRGEDDDTPLNKAIDRANIKLVDFLLKRDALPNEYSLNCAAQTGCIAVAKLIVEHNKNQFLNSKVYNYQTAVHAAASRGHTAMLQYLLSIGANLNEPDVNGNLPLHVAVRNGHDNVVIEIIKTPGSQIKIVNHQNISAFEIRDVKKSAEEQQKLEAASNPSATALLVQFQSFAKQHKLGCMNSPEQHLFCAVRAGDLNAAEVTLKLFPKLKINDNVDPFLCNPLHEAILRKQKALFDFLIKQPNIDVNAATPNNERPIHFAVATHDMYMLNTLLNRPEIQINVQGDFEYTPLHEAIERSNRPAVIALLARPEIDLSIRCRKGALAKQLVPFNDYNKRQITPAYIAVKKLIEDREIEILKTKSDSKHSK